MDLVALLLLGSLVVTGLVTPEEAVSGFSSPAVITVWAMFILSAGLARTGVANRIGKQVLKLAGDGELRLLAVIMLTAGVLSAFMNNIGVVAMFLPVILDIARRTGRSPGKLLLPLIFGALMGGMTTLISTPTNLLVSNALLEGGFEPLGLFDFTAVGALLLVVGTLFMVVLGRRWLPATAVPSTLAQVQARGDITGPYHLEERLAVVTLPADSELTGKTLADSRIGLALGLNILSIDRNGRTQIAPTPDAVLQAGDRLLVLGKLNRLDQLSRAPAFITHESGAAHTLLISQEIGVAEFTIEPDSRFIDRTLAEMDVRRRFGLNVLAIRHNGRTFRTNLQNLRVQAGDKILLQGRRDTLSMLSTRDDFRLLDETAVAEYGLTERLLAIRIPEDSPLVGQTLVESHLARAYGLTALVLQRSGGTQIMPDPATELHAGDVLTVAGRARDLDVVRGLARLNVTHDPQIDLASLRTSTLSLAEAVLSPHTTLVGKTLSRLQFREKYGLNVLAIWRNGRAYRSNLADMPLHFGDTLLLFGPHANLLRLGTEPDFIVLQEDAQEELRVDKAPLAALIMAGVVISVLIGWLPIAIAAIIGATLMVLAGCLTMDEAYRSIEWKAVFLIAGMLPLGVAMEQTGAAAYLAQGMIGLLGPAGPRAVLAGLFGLTLLATQFLPNAVAAVLLAPIAITSAAEMGVSPYPLVLAVAYAATSSFATPVAHPGNVLVMGPGGYRFADYVRVGLPLAIVLLGTAVLFLPLVWPF